MDRSRSGGYSGPKDVCYNYGGNHYALNCLHLTPTQRGGNQQAASQHQIHTMVDNCQADFQASPIQMTGKLFGQSVSILIDTKATECFTNPKVVSRLSIRPGCMSNAWMVQYGNRAKQRLAEHKDVVNYEDKVVSCIDNFGNLVENFGSQKPLELRCISTMQLKKAQRKGYSIIAVMVSYLDNVEKNPKDYPVLREFLDFFPEDLTKLPPKREFDFSIELLPGIEPQSKAPYRMTTTKLYELKAQLQELIR
ncbi:uncharacterized protein LOC131061877 [Cryptomeria japonica]|uniref:uncharacterized protein LOC131061877 n=1 Tax=Cryptomeria japonica TaxID=3369 RepID=UPI0025AC684C|nr:uncharacterized protein LOC131061877 [Cryptomeria japonica]